MWCESGTTEENVHWKNQLLVMNTLKSNDTNFLKQNLPMKNDTGNDFHPLELHEV